MISHSPHNHWLHRFAVLTAVATMLLLGAGGLVTSHGVGMAVPDWPNTYGYNMFFFPISQWVGGIFYEHTHRLIASGVGLLTVILALWFYGHKAKRFLRWVGSCLLVLAAGTSVAAPKHWPDAVVLGLTGVAAVAASFFWPRCGPSPGWLRRLGIVAFFAVLLQGVLGGLRVVLFKDQIGIFHAALAQLFFMLTCVLALFTSQWWQEKIAKVRGENISATVPSTFACLVMVTTLLIFGQLVLGATMRHQHAGLPIPDFPLAYGKIWPAMDPVSVAQYNQQRLEVIAANPITSSQIALQMAHRLVAMLILAFVGACAFWARRRLGGKNHITRLSVAWLGFILLQGLLGAATIWSNKAADFATAHVLIGALALALGGLLSIVAVSESLLLRTSRATIPEVDTLQPEFLDLPSASGTAPTR